MRPPLRPFVSSAPGSSSSASLAPAPGLSAPGVLAALGAVGSRHGAAPTFASKDPPARLCRVSVGVLYLFCGCCAPHPPAPGLSASGVLAALGAVGGRPGAAPPGAGGMVRNVINS